MHISKISSYIVMLFGTDTLDKHAHARVTNELNNLLMWLLTLT